MKTRGTSVSGSWLRFAVFLIVCLVGCAGPAYHVISLQPHPAGEGKASSQRVVGVLQFEDSRTSPRLLGKRIRSNGKEEQILLDTASAAEIITDLLIKSLKARGIGVVQLSSWQADPQHLSDLPKEVDLAIAGKIEALEVEAHSTLVKTTVRYRVRLSARLGFKKEGRVVTRTAESSPEETILRFDPAKMEKGFNEALALAQSNLLEGLF
jgi:hypothetical protein